MKSRSRTGTKGAAEARVYAANDGCFLPDGEALKVPSPCGGPLGRGVLCRRSWRSKSGVNKHTRQGQVFNTSGSGWGALAGGRFAVRRGDRSKRVRPNFFIPSQPAMKNSSASTSKANRRLGRSRSGTKHQANIAKSLERLDELRPESAQAAGLIGLLRSWLADESGYDEEIWPKLKKALDQERRRVGAASLFHDGRRRARFGTA